MNYALPTPCSLFPEITMDIGGKSVYNRFIKLVKNDL